MRAPRARTCVLGLAAALVAAAPAAALHPDRRLTQYPLRVWYAEDGLPSNSVLSVLQARDGFLWAGTEEGLARFDGVRFVPFDRRAVPGLSSGNFWALLEDRQRRLWVGMRGGGLCLFENRACSRTFTEKDGLPGDQVRALLEDRKGRLWVGTRDGLVTIENGSVVPAPFGDRLPAPGAGALLEDGRGVLWIGGPKGLARWDGHDLTVLGVGDGLPGDSVRALAEDRDGSLVVGTSRGLARVRGGTVEPFPLPDGLVPQVLSLLVDRHGVLWVGRDSGGLLRVRGGRVDALGPREGLPGATVYRVLEDHEGSLWLATVMGLARLRDARLAVFSSRDSLVSDFVQSIAEDEDGTLFIGGGEAGLARVDGERVTTLGRREGLPEKQAYSLLTDRGGLWVGTNGGGLARLERGAVVRVLTTRDSLPADQVRVLSPARAGGVWAGTTAGLAHVSGGTVEPLALPGGAEWISALVEDADGTLWIGTDGAGLRCRRSDGRFTSLTTANGLGSNRVSVLHRDGDSLWIATHGGGLHRLRAGRLSRLGLAQGLFDDNVFQIVDDGAGSFWMSGNRGIFRVERSDLEAAADGRLSRLVPEVLGTADGMLSVEGNGGTQPGAIRTRDGRLFFPTVRGAVVIDRRRLPLDAPEPRVEVEEVVADGTVFPAGGPLTLGPGTERLEIRYTALSFRAPERVRFRYRLEGADRELVDAGTRRTAYYSFLRPGTYVFQVVACNDDGVWNLDGARRTVTLRPYFHQTPLAAALLGAAVAAVAITLHRLRLRGLRRREAELEATVGARTAELRGAYDELRRADEEIARLSKASPFEDAAGWARANVAELARAAGVARVDVWLEADRGFRAVGDLTGPEPDWDSLAHGPLAGAPVLAGERTFFPVTGMSGELMGALAVDGAVLGDGKRRLLSGFARQLGALIELHRLREQLSAAEARQARSLDEMRKRGIATLSVCPECGGCAGHETERCPRDGSALETPYVLPYRVGDRYRLVSRLGEGGMGVVFEAFDERLGREVALKVVARENLLDPVRLRLEREARTIARLSHPGIVALFDVGELDDGAAFLVMERLRGLDLFRVLRQYGAGAPSQAARVARQAGSALAAAHAGGVVHRDVKPANLFLVPSAVSFDVKVLDFGLARAPATDADLTRSGMVVGTPAYVAPELLQGRPANERSDLYALGAVLYEVLTGRKVVPGTELAEVWLGVLTAEPPLPSSLVPGLPREVDELLLAALAKAPSSRPADLAAWSAALADALDRVPAGTGQGPGWPSAVAPGPPGDAGEPTPLEATRPMAG